MNSVGHALWTQFQCPATATTATVTATTIAAATITTTATTTTITAIATTTTAIAAAAAATTTTTTPDTATTTAIAVTTTTTTTNECHGYSPLAVVPCCLQNVSANAVAARSSSSFLSHSWPPSAADVTNTSHRRASLVLPSRRCLTCTALTVGQLVKKHPAASLPHSQQPATYSFSQPHKSTPCCSVPFFNVHFNIILLSMPRTSKRSPSLRFHHQSLYEHIFSSMRATWSAHLILFHLITRTIFGEQ